MREGGTKGGREGSGTRPLKRCMTDVFGGKQNYGSFCETQPRCYISGREFSFRLDPHVQILRLCTLYLRISSRYFDKNSHTVSKNKTKRKHPSTKRSISEVVMRLLREEQCCVHIENYHLDFFFHMVKPCEKTLCLTLTLSLCSFRPINTLQVVLCVSVLGSLSVEMRQNKMQKCAKSVCRRV